MGQSQVDALSRENAVQVGPSAKTKGAIVCQVSPCDTWQVIMTHRETRKPDSPGVKGRVKAGSRVGGVEGRTESAGINRHRAGMKEPRIKGGTAPRSGPELVYRVPKLVFAVPGKNFHPKSPFITNPLTGLRLRSTLPSLKTCCFVTGLAIMPKGGFRCNGDYSGSCRSKKQVS
jgi:hypothetical protein